MAEWRLVTKIYVGFGVILALLIGVALVAYLGFTGVQERVEKTDRVDLLIEGIDELGRCRM
jgi:hypothetical protein